MLDWWHSASPGQMIWFTVCLRKTTRDFCCWPMIREQEFHILPLYLIRLLHWQQFPVTCTCQSNGDSAKNCSNFEINITYSNATTYCFTQYWLLPCGYGFSAMRTCNNQLSDLVFFIEQRSGSYCTLPLTTTRFLTFCPLIFIVEHTKSYWNIVPVL